jgi:hypothetical protein
MMTGASAPNNGVCQRIVPAVMAAAIAANRSDVECFRKAIFLSPMRAA